METKQTDPIIAELRAIREAYAARFYYDVDAMFKDLRAKQAASGREYVWLPARPRELDVQVVAPEPLAADSRSAGAHNSKRETD